MWPFKSKSQELEPPKCPECEGSLIHFVRKYHDEIVDLVKCTQCDFMRETVLKKVRLVVDNTKQ